MLVAIKRKRALVPLPIGKPDIRLFLLLNKLSETAKDICGVKGAHLAGTRVNGLDPPQPDGNVGGY